VTSWII